MVLSSAGDYAARPGSSRKSSGALYTEYGNEHLKSADWFDVERYPTISFRTSGIQHVSGNLWTASGLLTARAITRPIEMSVEFGGATTDPWGNAKIGAIVKSQVDREAWGMKWNMPLDAGGFVVDRTVWLRVDVEAVFTPSARP